MNGPVLGAGSGTFPARSSELLGFPPDARLLIVNLDDFGMYHAVNAAVVRSIEEGIGSSCSLMVPCPWAVHAMRLLRERPEIPFGIHLTLVCEMTDYRWRPLTSRAEVPSLLDESGELFSAARIPELMIRARLEEVEVEFRAQIESVLEAGLRPTHLDWHCVADGGRADIFDLTVALAEEYGLAVRAWLEPARRKIRQRGLPVVDHDFLDSFALDLDSKAAKYAQLLRELPVGLSEWAVHPGLGDAEAQEIDSGWRVRRTDYDFLTSSYARELLEQQRITVIDYRAIQEVWSRSRYTDRSSGQQDPVAE
ncbi:polysaccharide deacetylase family protein [Micromonospora sp. CA-111912]|uniref:polysaccharide deacetylase family protein n=1 Tax=Micromonospora sp. CA-111912 TaxID=3239955 RepID=UPI003D8A42A9